MKELEEITADELEQAMKSANWPERYPGGILPRALRTIRRLEGVE